VSCQMPWETECAPWMNVLLGSVNYRHSCL
jgi:hypothetical protein